MSAVSVGRVGGLAVALGVGAAALSAAGVAWADSTSADQSPSNSTSSSAARHVSAGPSAAAARVRGARPASSPAARVGKPAAARPATAVRVPAGLPTANASVSETVTATATVAELSTGGDPSAPASTPLEWTAMAAARRTPVRAAASVAPAASAAAAVDPAGYELGACTQSSAACSYIIGASGVPIPSTEQAQAAIEYYLAPNGQSPVNTAQIVFTPEGAYPVTGIKVLPLTISADQGQTILENTIETLQPGLGETEVPITIFGYSQSAVISSRLQRSLVADPTLLPGLNRDTTTFVTVGQEMSPNGGWFARYPGLNVPAAGEYFFGSTPEDAFPTTNYTLEYDGFADSPRYPGNILSSLNAALGIVLVHTNYVTPAYFAKTYAGIDDLMATLGPGLACQQGATSCTQLPTTAADQKYYFIQTPDLPLLAPVRAIPFIGKPLAALVQPVLKVIVDLGYADPAHGFTSATQPMANLPLPFGVFPRVSPIEVIQKLGAGVKQGIEDFVDALKNPVKPTPPKLPTINELIATAGKIISTLPARISAGASALYATLLATADFVNSALISLPVYDGQLFIEGITQALSGEFIQGIVNAVFRPIAADVGLVTTIGVFQVLVWLEGFAAALTGCGPAAPTTGLCIAG